MRVAIVHHWFVTRGGGERVAECIASLFPDAEIFTLVADARGIPDGLRKRRIHTSFLQRLPLAKSHHRHMMPFYPAAAESLDLRGFDLVISSDSGPVKGIRTDPDAVHICYCHSPMRYLYDGYESYRSQMGQLTRSLFSATASRVRSWDEKAAQRVTHFIANSEYVAGRIERFYGRKSTVIHPPIDTQRARVVELPGKHYLCAGRLVGYKRTELMIEACIRLGRTLRIVGTGPEEIQLKKLAGASGGSASIAFLGEMSTEALWQEYAECRALLFAADEDFGMVPLEAQACGRPVIAYGAGGSLETVNAGGASPTGIFFREQTVESVIQGILSFEAAEAESGFNSARIQSWAAEFATPLFLKQMREFVLEKLPRSEQAMTPTEPTVEYSNSDRG